MFFRPIYRQGTAEPVGQVLPGSEFHTAAAATEKADESVEFVDSRHPTDRDDREDVTRCSRSDRNDGVEDARNLYVSTATL